MKTEVYSALVNLCADICRRNGKRKLVWIADRDKALAYSVRSDRNAPNRPPVVCQEILSGKLANGTIRLFGGRD